MEEKNGNKVALLIWSQSSNIWLSVKRVLSNTYSIIETSKDYSLEVVLDFYNKRSLEESIIKLKEILNGKKLEVVFINSGVLIAWNSLSDASFFEQEEQWNKAIRFHLHIVEFVKNLIDSNVIDGKTKIIYNASIQVFSPKKWYEDYAVLKKTTSELLMWIKGLNITILCASLIKSTKMTDYFLKELSDQWFDIEEYIQQQFPKGQPTLDDLNNVVMNIIANSEATRKKYVILDWVSTSQDYLTCSNAIHYNSYLKELEM